MDRIDIWTSSTAVHVPTSTDLYFETLNGISPLDQQFGVERILSIPDKLRDVFFDQPDATQTELDAFEDDPAKLPEMAL